MKKGLILFVLFLFMFLTIAVVDGEDERERTGQKPDLRKDKIERNVDNSMEKPLIHPRLDAKERVEIKEKYDERRILKDKNLLEERKKVKESKDKYLKARENYLSKKKELSDKKDKYGECLNSEEDKCKRLVKETKLKAKEHLMNSAELIINHLEQLKVRVQASNDLTEDEVKEIIDKIDEQLKEIENAKSVLENLNESSSREEIKNAAETIRNAWHKIKVHLYIAKVKHVGSGIRTLIAKANILGERVQERASEINSESLNSKINEYFKIIDSAEEHYKAAKGVWEKEVSPGKIDDLVKEANQHLRESNKTLKSAREKLREIIKELKDNNKEVSLDTEVDSE